MKAQQQQQQQQKEKSEFIGDMSSCNIQLSWRELGCVPKCFVCGVYDTLPLITLTLCLMNHDHAA